MAWLQHSVLSVLVLLLTAASGLSARAEKYPNGPIRILVPYAPGGATDVSARILAEHLRPMLGGESIVVENKVGASGLIALEEMMRSKPDGLTLMIGNVSTNALTPLLLKHRTKIDFQKEVVTLARVGDSPVMLIATIKDFPPDTLMDFIAYAKALPGKLRYSSAGLGSIQQIDTAVLASKTGIDLVHIPTKAGAAQVLRDVVAGDAHITWGNPAAAQKQIEAGLLKVLAVVGDTRLPQFKDVPTFTELGLPGVGSVQWQTLLAPAQTPKEVQAAINKMFRDVFALPACQEAMTRVGFLLPPAQSLADTQAWSSGELARYRKIITDLKITAEE